VTSGAVTRPDVRGGPRRLADVARLVALLAPGERIFLPGSAGEAIPLVEALTVPGAPALDVTASFVPGINPSPADGLAEGSRFTCPFAHPARRATQAMGAFRHLPMSYGAFVAHLAATARFDTCVVHLSPPDAAGRCSLGAAVEFAPVAMRRSARVVGVINSRMPSIPGADGVAFADLDLVVETDAPLRTYDVGEPSPEAQAIARTVAAFVTDGATLQVGLGKVPDALLKMLSDRRGLRLWSGMLSDGIRALVEAGSLDPAFAHTSCVQVGTADHYAWLDGRAGFAVRGCEVTHDPRRLAALDRLVAVNGALEVDLFGQANLETVNGRTVSGIGGAPDFARAAALAPDAISVVALPATGGREGASRIVPRLAGPVSLPRNDVDVVVTEHGAADLRGLSAVERAERLIAVAAPAHRPGLTDAFREIAGRL
jgi:acyl-CoA hydrolase